MVRVIVLREWRILVRFLNSFFLHFFSFLFIRFFELLPFTRFYTYINNTFTLILLSVLSRFSLIIFPLPFPCSGFLFISFLLFLLFYFHLSCSAFLIFRFLSSFSFLSYPFSFPSFSVFPLSFFTFTLLFFPLSPILLISLSSYHLSFYPH